MLYIILTWYKFHLTHIPLNTFATILDSWMCHPYTALGLCEKWHNFVITVALGKKHITCWMYIAVKWSGRVMGHTVEIFLKIWKAIFSICACCWLCQNIFFEVTCFHDDLKYSTWKGKVIFGKQYSESIHYFTVTLNNCQAPNSRQNICPSLSLFEYV